MSNAFDEIKKIKDYNTSAHNEEKAKKSVYYVEPDGNIIKNFILSWGRKIIDFMAWLGICLAIITFTLLLALFIDSFSNRDTFFGSVTPLVYFLYMIFVPLLILIITIISNYFIYVFIDIRDSLKNINQKIKALRG